jgi:predicted DNA repair protein MutK
MEESSIMTWMSSNVNIVADTAIRAKYIITLEAARELGVVLSVLVLCNSIV